MIQENFPFNQREWVPKTYFDQSIKDKTLRITSYNILADSLHENTKNDLDPEFYIWKNRRSKLLNEFKNLDSDIFLLQEFEKDPVFVEELQKLGYDISFKPRPNNKCEGCAVAWKFDRFELLNLYTLQFNFDQDSHIYNKDNVCLIAILKIQKENRILIAASTHLLFNHNRGDIKLGQSYLILNTLNQLKTKYTTSTTKTCIFLCGDLNSTPNSAIYKLITQGQLNCSNMNYKLVSGQHSGHLSHYEVESNNFVSELFKWNTSIFREIDVQFEENFPTSNKLGNILEYVPEISVDDKIRFKKVNPKSKSLLFSPIKLKSAYSENLKNILNLLKGGNSFLSNITNKEDFKNLDVYSLNIDLNSLNSINSFLSNKTMEPPLTFYANQQMMIVDYIFFDGDIEVIRTLNTPNIRMLLNLQSIPNQDYPSDHFSLTAEFLMK